MKKILVFLLLCGLLVALAVACGDEKPLPGTEEKDNSNTATESAVVATRITSDGNVVEVEPRVDSNGNVIVAESRASSSGNLNP